MHLHINHMYCFSPEGGIKGDTMYWCRYLVSLERIGKGKTYYDEPEEDWTNLITQVKFFDEEEYTRRKEWDKTHPSDFDLSDEKRREWSTKNSPIFKPEVMQWLEDNVKDRPDKDYPKGWCVGDAAYNAKNTLQLSLFFHRKADALNFIKTWSKYKKPTTYFDYFKEVSLELDFETGKLVPEVGGRFSS